jgi:chromosomal replication initiation ATPase DnaA
MVRDAISIFLLFFFINNIQCCACKRQWLSVAFLGVMEALLEEGCIIVATSNRAPWDLNRHGLHEDLFGHFVQNLLEACQPYQLSAEQDYRRLLVHITLCSLLL